MEKRITWAFICLYFISLQSIKRFFSVVIKILNWFWSTPFKKSTGVKKNIGNYGLGGWLKGVVNSIVFGAHTSYFSSLMDKSKELLGNLIDWDEMSDQQIWILEQRARYVSVYKLVQKWKIQFHTTTELGIQAFYSALMRGSPQRARCVPVNKLGLPWT